MIKVSTVRRPIANSTNVKVDRTSVLGNPFFMKNEIMRNEVCDKFEVYFKKKMEERNNPVHTEMLRLYHIAAKGDLTLQCHCAPRRCHADTIKKFLDIHLNKA